MRKSRLFIGVWVFAAGCVGAIDRSAGSGAASGAGGAGGRMEPVPVAGGSSPEQIAARPAGVAPPARVRRLTATELKNATRDLFLGDAMIDDVDFPAETAPRAYDNNAEKLGFSEVFGTALQHHAEAVAASAVQRLPNLVAGCASAPGTSDAENRCATEFIARFLPKVYRRPATTAEAAALNALYTESRKLTTFEGAIATVIEAMLQSPSFLYRTEFGDPTRLSQHSPLTDHERASALSFLLWRSTPDDELLAAADGGRLHASSDVDTQARRLLASPRAKDSLRAFFRQWLELTGTTAVIRDKGAYPDFDSALAIDMAQEVDAFVDQHAWGSGGFRDMLTATTTTADARLARLYGRTSAAASAAPLQLDATQRAGVLTLPAFIATHSPPTAFSPVQFGRVVRARLLCQPLPDPPANVPSLPPPSATVTPRERFAAHAADPSCKGCHNLMDPVGFGFERYDGIGRYQERTGSTPLTGAGQLAGTDVDGPFTGAVELAQRLAASKLARDCFASNLFEYAHGRHAALDAGEDAKAMNPAMTAFATGDGNITELLLAVTTADPFLFRDSTALPGGK